MLSDLLSTSTLSLYDYPRASHSDAFWLPCCIQFDCQTKALFDRSLVFCLCLFLVEAGKGHNLGRGYDLDFGSRITLGEECEEMKKLKSLLEQIIFFLSSR
jgi:hypothetical protein